MLNGEDYFTRKGNYAVKGLIICDDSAKITRVEMGWPGSVHDNREYLLGDSAFSASSVLAPAFKKGSNSNLRDDQCYFNTKLAINHPIPEDWMENTAEAEDE